jgi:hypothetical protein
VKEGLPVVGAGRSGMSYVVCGRRGRYASRHEGSGIVIS